MRILFVVVAFIFSVPAKAQHVLQGNYFNYTPGHFFADSSQRNAANKKWFVSKYMGISSSVVFFNGRSASIFSAPIGLQLNRKLSNNWYAFAGLSASPSYTNFNRSFLSANTSKSLPGNAFGSNSFNLYPKAELGLMYINDQKTFSVSGSISVERSNYSFAPYNQFNTVRPGLGRKFGAQ